MLLCEWKVKREIADLVGDQRTVGAELGRKGQPFAIFG
jgi:hypothetical protein